MTRDLIAKRIHWSFIIWLAGLVNVTAMLPQLARIIRTRNIEGLSLAMFMLYFLMPGLFLAIIVAGRSLNTYIGTLSLWSA